MEVFLRDDKEQLMSLKDIVFLKRRSISCHTGHRRYIRFELGARNCFDRDSPKRQNNIGERSA